MAYFLANVANAIRNELIVSLQTFATAYTSEIYAGLISEQGCEI